MQTMQKYSEVYFPCVCVCLLSTELNSALGKIMIGFKWNKSIAAFMATIWLDE